MSWPVYTERFVLAGTVGTLYTYTVPVGKRAVVTSVVGGTTSPSSAHVYLQVAGHNVAIIRFQDPQTSAVFNCRIAAYGGETISLLTVGAGTAAACSGYLFDDAAAARAPSNEVRELPERATPRSRA